jgi:hypothetical protein
MMTFEGHKKEEMNVTASLMASPKDTILCPVCAAAAIVRRFRSYPGSSKYSPVSIGLVGGVIKHVTSNQMIVALRDAVVAVRKVKLGFKKHKVGKHSMRFGSAMAINLGKCLVFMIMLIGHWSRDDFFATFEGK